jgi:hypothetical protein
VLTSPRRPAPLTHLPRARPPAWLCLVSLRAVGFVGNHGETLALVNGQILHGLNQRNKELKSGMSPSARTGENGDQVIHSSGGSRVDARLELHTCYIGAHLRVIQNKRSAPTPNALSGKPLTRTQSSARRTLLDSPSVPRRTAPILGRTAMRIYASKYAGYLLGQGRNFAAVLSRIRTLLVSLALASETRPLISVLQ